jgi:hypothetical protein
MTAFPLRSTTKIRVYSHGTDPRVTANIPATGGAPPQTARGMQQRAGESQQTAGGTLPTAAGRQWKASGRLVWGVRPKCYVTESSGIDRLTFGIGHGCPYDKRLRSVPKACEAKRSESPLVGRKKLEQNQVRPCESSIERKERLLTLIGLSEELRSVYIHKIIYSRVSI